MVNFTKPTTCMSVQNHAPVLYFKEEEWLVFITLDKRINDVYIKQIGKVINTTNSSQVGGHCWLK